MKPYQEEAKKRFEKERFYSAAFLIGDAGPVEDLLTRMEAFLLAELETAYGEGRNEGYADGFKQGRFDTEMDASNQESS